MNWERIIDELQHAHAQWQLHGAESVARAPEPIISLPRARAEEIVTQARELLVVAPTPSLGNYDSALIVTKAPHIGSDRTVAATLARCLAFGLTIERVAEQAPEDADRIAHALYPDIWLNFVRLPSGNSVWSRIDKTFDKSDYAAIFGEPYRRDAVVTGHQACLDNKLTPNELMTIWQTGRESLTRTSAVASYGFSGAKVLFGAQGDDTYQWYRGPFPVGIHKIGPNLMAFSLRHERLYEGRPVIVLNGHFTLLSQRFYGVGGCGATVIELGLGDHPTIRDVRLRLVGAADQPEECLPGTIRRDAYDGFFSTDAPDQPVVPWANAVHASDGYLSGAIEAAAVLGETGTGAMSRRLSGLGYSPVEVDTLIMKDPIVLADGDEQRLTKRTAMLEREECVAAIRRWFPPLNADHSHSVSAYLLSALIEVGDTSRLDLALDRPRREPGSRPPVSQSVRTCGDLPDTLSRDGQALIDAGGLGLLVPLAGSGGRFGGYDVAEGKGKRLKPLLPVFKLDGRLVSSMDVRAAHAHFLGRRIGVPVPMMLSCSSSTEPSVQEWLANKVDVEAETVRVPEMYRIKLGHWNANVGAPDISVGDNILRDQDGVPLFKPSGSLGMLMAAAQSGVLERWQRRGVRVAVAANADDAGFRVDPRVLGMFSASPTLDAVVLTTPVVVDEASTAASGQRGGLLRERPIGDRWSAYIEEHAQPDAELRHEQFNTNQIYFRVESLHRIFSNPTGDSLDEIRQSLPLYFEVKQVRVGDHQVDALHAYQTFADVLRLMPSVAALSIGWMPRVNQARGYAPLKFQSDIKAAQAVLDAIGAFGDELLFAPDN